MVAYINIGSYYLIGIPAGVLMGWIFNLGVLVRYFTFIFFTTKHLLLVLTNDDKDQN